MMEAVAFGIFFILGCYFVLKWFGVLDYISFSIPWAIIPRLLLAGLVGYVFFRVGSFFGLSSSLVWLIIGLVVGYFLIKILAKAVKIMGVPLSILVFGTIAAGILMTILA